MITRQQQEQYIKNTKAEIKSTENDILYTRGITHEHRLGLYAYQQSLEDLLENLEHELESPNYYHAW